MSTTIIVAETVTMPSIASLHEDIRSALSHDGGVVLDCSALAEADLSFVQLVSAARIQARRDGRSLALSGPANACLAAVLARAGLTEGFTAADTDFWFHGALPQ